MKLLSKYKADNRYTIQDLADKFNVNHRTMYTWIRADNVFVAGRQGSKQIIRRNAPEVLAEEVQDELT